MPQLTTKQFNKVLGARVKRNRLNAGLRQVDVAKAVGITERGYWGVEKGTTTVRYTVGCALAEFFADELMVEMLQNRRWRDCTECGKRFLNVTDNPDKVICTLECKRMYRQRKTRSYEEGYRENRMRRLINAEKRQGEAILGFEKAILAMCKGCEPMGACKDSSCALRPVSPFPLRERSIA